MEREATARNDQLRNSIIKAMHTPALPPSNPRVALTRPSPQDTHAATDAVKAQNAELAAGVAALQNAVQLDIQGSASDQPPTLTPEGLEHPSVDAFEP